MTIDRAAPRRRRAPARAPAPRRRGIFAILGPGLITGASDDDPSGIATYSQAGAQFGTGLVWSLLFTYPLMVCIQEISGRIGRVTGRGIAGNLCRNYPLPVVYAIVGLLFLANIINLGADLGAMAASLQLLIGGPRLLFVFLFGVGSALLQVFIDYSRYASLLKWLCLSLFSYVATVFVVDVPWGQVLHDVVVPHVTLDNAELTVLVAVFGTTISPYLFFWQASEEVEEIKEDPKAKPLKQAEEQAPAEFERIRLDTYAGMAFSNASVALVHGMSRPIGAFFHVPHGLSNAMLLPEITAFSAPAALERYADCARAMGVAEEGEGSQGAVARLLDELRRLNADLGVPSPQAYGIDPARYDALLPVMANQALASGSPANNPRVPSSEEIIELYRRVYD